MVPPSITLLRLLAGQQARGWRWRGLVAASLLGAWWYGRASSFGPGSTAWFPGGEAGLVLFTVFFAAAGVLLGVELLGQWERHHAMDFLRDRLRGRWRFLAILMAAGGILGALPLLIVSFWAPIGAWRAGFGVRWQLPAIYFAAAALPVFVGGLAWGMAARAILRRDISAQVAGVLLLVPACWFRLAAVPIRDVFAGGGFSLGVTIPRDLLVADALALYGYALLGLAVAGFALHHLPAGHRPAGILGRFLPSLVRIPGALASQGRELGPGGVAAGLLFLAVGMGLSATIARDARHILPATFGAVPEPDQAWRAGLPAAGLSALPFAFRRAELPANPDDPIHVSLTVDGAALTVPLTAAGVSFGGYLAVAEVRADNGTACLAIPVHARTYPPDPARSGHALFFEPPLQPGEDVVLEFRLLPPSPSEGDRRFHRRWREAFQPRFHSPAAIGTWEGEGFPTPFVSGPGGTSRALRTRTPFEVVVPAHPGLRWAAGDASVEDLGDGRLRLTQTRPDLLASLVAGPLVTVTPPREAFAGLPLRFELLPGREGTVHAISAVNQRAWTRLGRLFPDEAHPIVFHETPLARGQPARGTALSMEWLDLLGSLLPRIEHPEQATRGNFVGAFRTIRQELVRELVARHLHGSDFPELLEDALAEYLAVYALRDPPESDRREYILTPWQVARGRTVSSPMAPSGMGQIAPEQFLIEENRREGWIGPANPRDRGPDARGVPQTRLLAFHHHLRGWTGDDAFVAGLRELWRRTAEGAPPSTALYREAMEAACGEDLGAFFREWLEEGVLPDLRIVEGQAVLLASPDRRSVEYTISLEVENRGTGTVRVPWGLATEGDDVRGTVWLGPGETREVQLRSLDRPVMWEIDPEGWLPRLRGDAAERRLFFRAIKEL